MFFGSDCRYFKIWPLYYSFKCSTTDSPIHLKNNVSYYSTNETIIKELMCADRLYKNSLGSILIRIPDENLAGSNLYMIDSEEGTFILDPQYIIGFVPVGPNGKIDTIICNQVNPSKPFKGLDSLYEERTYAVDVDNTVSTGSKK